MEFRWQWATGVDSLWQEALVRAFDPEAMEPASPAPRRRIAGRAYGVLKAAGPIPFDVFVKVYEHRSFGERLRHLWGRSGAAREFAAAVRLRDLGLPVPRPLALVNESGSWGCRRTFCLMERLTGVEPLAAAMRSSGGPESAEFAALAQRVGRLLVDLAVKGVWHRDASAENLLVARDGQGRPSQVLVVDARHVRFVPAPSVAAFEGMLAALAAFLLAGGEGDRQVSALVAAAATVAAEHGGALGRAQPEAILPVARQAARDLVAREVQKGERTAEDLDAFARRYASADDAAGYRDRRFARSRYGRRVEAAERRIVEELLAVRRIGGPVLDAPCGAGRFLTIFAAQAAQAVGADASGEMLGLARQACREAGRPCPCLAADVRRLPFADRQFDLAFSMRLLHRVRAGGERVEVLKELARVSRRWVLFSFYNRRSWRGLRDRFRGRYGGETVPTLVREAADAGLRVEEVRPVGWLGRQTLVLCTRAE